MIRKNEIDKMSTKIVQKSNPLISLTQTEMGLVEFKILDAYLAKINSHKPEERSVVFDRGELEELIGVTRITKKDLSDRLNNLFQIVTISDDRYRNGFRKISLFEVANAYQDDDGIWQIELMCTPTAKEYIFNIETIGYLKYKLQNIIKLNSRYSYVLYLYIESNRYRKCWQISLDELKGLLRCTSAAYDTYGRFNDLILKKCVSEINEKTSTKIKYEPLRRGRFVNRIKFTIIGEEETNVEKSDINNDYWESYYESELAYFLGCVACDNEFTREQIRVIQDLVVQIIPSYDTLQCCDYLREKMNIMNMYASRNEITDRYNYLLKMLRGEVEPSEQVNTANIREDEHSKNDFDALVKK